MKYEIIYDYITPVGILQNEDSDGNEVKYEIPIELENNQFQAFLIWNAEQETPLDYITDLPEPEPESLFDPIDKLGNLILSGWSVEDNTLTSGSLSLDGGSALIRGNFESGSTGFELNGNTGRAEFNDIVARKSGTIGGWSIVEDMLSSGELTLDGGSALIKGNYVENDTGFLLNGETGEAKFNEISANKNGFIAGWEIDSGSLKGGNAILSSGGELRLGTGDNIAVLSALNALHYLWLGNNAPENAPFSVTKEGFARIESGSIGGWAISESSLNKDGLVLDANNTQITGNFSSGTKGFRLDGLTGDAEFNNISARGEIRSSVFTKGEIQATSGTLGLFRSAGILMTDFTSDNSPFDIDIYDPKTGHAQLFVVNDILRVKTVTGDNWLKVTTVTNNITYYTYTVTLEYGSISTFESGNSIVNYGQSGQGFLIMTADDTNSPYYSVRTHTGTPWTTQNEIVRLGNLNGFLTYMTDTYGVGIGDGSSYLKWDMNGGLEIKGKLSVVSGGDVAKIDFSNVTAKYALADVAGGSALSALTSASAGYTETAASTLYALSAGSSDFTLTAGSALLANNTTNVGTIPSTNIVGWAKSGDTTVIDGGKIATGTIEALQIKANTITASQIAAGTITATQIATGTLTSNEIAALTITSAQIAANTITAAKIQSGTITTTEIAATTILGTNIAAGTITASNISVANLQALSANMGNLHMDGFIDIGSSGGLYQGSGCAASPNTGLKIWNDNGIGRLATYNGETQQIHIGTDGRLYIGDDRVILDEYGITVLVDIDGYVTKGMIFNTNEFGTPNLGVIGGIASYYEGVTSKMLYIQAVGYDTETEKPSVNISASDYISGNSGGITCETSLVTIGTTEDGATTQISSTNVTIDGTVGGTNNIQLTIPESSTFYVGSTSGATSGFYTISDVLYYMRGKSILGNVYIYLDTETFVENVVIKDIIIPDGSQLYIIGDTRTCVGHTYIDSGYGNPEGVTALGAQNGTVALSNSTTALTVTVGGGNPTWSTAGVVAGDYVMTYTGTSFSLVPLTSVSGAIMYRSGNWATLTPDGCSVTIIPKVHLTGTITNYCRNVTVKGLYINGNGDLGINNASGYMTISLCALYNCTYGVYANINSYTNIKNTTVMYCSASGYYANNNSTMIINYSYAIETNNGLYANYSSFVNTARTQNTWGTYGFVSYYGSTLQSSYCGSRGHSSYGFLCNYMSYLGAINSNALTTGAALSNKYAPTPAASPGVAITSYNGTISIS